MKFNFDKIESYTKKNVSKITYEIIKNTKKQYEDRENNIFLNESSIT